MVYVPRTAGRSALFASPTVIRKSAVQSSGVSGDADSGDRSAGDSPRTSMLAESAEIRLISMRGGVSERAAGGDDEWQAEAPKQTRIAVPATAILVIDRPMEARRPADPGRPAATGRAAARGSSRADRAAGLPSCCR